MKTVKVWLNHWFSTAYHIINLIKDDNQTRFHIIGSNANENCVYRSVCDEWETEPIIKSDDKYVEYCLDFCKRHDVELFIPRRRLTVITEHLEVFKNIGVRVLAEPNTDLVKILSDKIKTYEYFKSSVFVPEYRLINSANEFKKCYNELKNDKNRVCIKFASDEGAASFRVIDDRIKYNLFETVGMKITYADVVTVIERMENETFHPLIMMPYLSGKEISVDCLYMDSSEHIIIPREKCGGRIEKIIYNHDIMTFCEDFIKDGKLIYPFNIQFRYDGKIPYLLEINTRMSGGIQYSCLSEDVNIPNIAVNKLIGIRKSVKLNRKSCVFSYIETPVMIDNEKS